jgi:hypothetical protein
MQSQEHPLQSEYDYYLRNKADLVLKYNGKFIVIKGEEVLGSFDTDADAYKAGLLRFGVVPFFITRVLADNEKNVIPILELGLLNADS